MTRFHTTASGNVPSTEQEELDRDAEESAEAALSAKAAAEAKQKADLIEAKNKAIEKLLLADPDYAAVVNSKP